MMLKEISGFVVGAVLCTAVILGGGRVSLADETSEAFAFYLDYLKTAAAAEKIADVAPFMPDWWRGRYESADEATQASALERQSKLARDLKDVNLESEESLDDGVRLNMTATEQNDLPMRGVVTLMRSSDSFVIEETKWATSQ
ncbi:hypothetical protein [Pelagibius sp. Alg239-R121]|uniref:hypothetical protein n=1 Tax=Pelagibius sp. Alg239-R121 TaxID=2993448 RepID=UPI0024A6DE29|nr:hypothetical protein [Pelagibius sp. Alg239-R121]